MILSGIVLVIKFAYINIIISLVDVNYCSSIVLGVSNVL